MRRRRTTSRAERYDLHPPRYPVRMVAHRRMVDGQDSSEEG